MVPLSGKPSCDTPDTGSGDSETSFGPGAAEALAGTLFVDTHEAAMALSA